MLKIRLTRTGKTKRPHFRVVVTEHTAAAQGPYVAALGIWDPLTHKLEVDDDQLKFWMDRGARPTDRISRLLKAKGLKHKLIRIHERPARGPKKKAEKQEATLSEQAQATDDQAKAPATSPESPVAETSAEAPKATEIPAPEVAETPADQPAPESQPTDQVTKAEEAKPAAPVEPAASEVNTSNVKGEERTKSPAGDQA